MKGRFMIVRDYGEQTLSALCVFDGRHGLLQCSEWKEFARKESNNVRLHRKVGLCRPLLDGNGIEFQPLDVVNWKDYPYKPEVSFRIAHTGAKSCSTTK